MGGAAAGREGSERGGDRGPKISDGSAPSHETLEKLRTARAHGVTPREFDGGRTTAEIHEHYDQDGARCPAGEAWTTIVTRLSAWDDSNRERALKLTRHEDSLCRDCGLPLVVCRSKDSRLVVDSDVCRARRAIELTERKDAEDHKKSDPDWMVGRRYFARQFDPLRDSHLEKPKTPTPAAERRRGRSRR